ncbi:MAG TPA: phosphotransferase [Anaerolineales bacterium]
MMKLKHLFHNPDLANMLLKNWDDDETSPELLADYRISANAVYPFQKKDQVYFLRFCPASEKLKENIAAELEWIGYLRSQGYPAVEPVPSRTGETLLQKATPWGDYYASAFRRVPGEPVSESPLDDERIYRYGAALGRLHRLSGQYQPKTRRWTYADVLAWIENTMASVPVERQAFFELALLRKFFQALHAHPGNYGLVHYDFETDNVFYDPATGLCSVIDFDDAMYHWYGMDIDQALDSLQDACNLPDHEFHPRETLFLDGYRSQFALDDEQVTMRAAFRRFANLYGYARIARSMQEAWENEPEWLAGLRVKLRSALRARSANFGKPLAV